MIAIDQLGIPQTGMVDYDPEAGLKVRRRPEGYDKPERYGTVVNDVIRQGIRDYGMV